MRKANEKAVTWRGIERSIWLGSDVTWVRKIGKLSIQKYTNIFEMTLQIIPNVRLKTKI